MEKLNIEENATASLIFEVACLGCGKTVFNLPFIKDTHHTMTCHECGEVTITHISEDGSMAMATVKQRNEALNVLIDDLFKTIKSYSVYSYDYYSESYKYWERSTGGFNWIKNNVTIDHNDYQVNITIKVICEGLKIRIRESHSIAENQKKKLFRNYLPAQK
jgi:transcription elongation factor Elf1